MAVSATFKADFSSFFTAVQKAEVELKSFETGAGKVEKSLARMTDQFSGRKLIQDATLMTAAIEKVGGVTALTGAELERVGSQAAAAAEKMRKMGIEVPPGIQKIADTASKAKDSTTSWASSLGSATSALSGLGIGLSAAAVVGFGKALLSDADALVKMSDRTGIGVQWLQKFQVVGDEAGNTIEEMTQGINQMQKRMEGDDKSFVGAMKSLNINLEQFKALRPEEQFDAISQAIRKIQDPAEQAKAAMDLFGKSGAELLPTLKRGFDDVRDSAVGMGESTARTLDQLGDDITALIRKTKALGAETIAWLVTYAQGPVVTAQKNLQDVNDRLGRIRDTALHLTTAGPLKVIDIPDEHDLAASDRQLEALIRHNEELAAAAKKAAAELLHQAQSVEEVGFIAKRELANIDTFTKVLKFEAIAPPKIVQLADAFGQLAPALSVARIEGEKFSLDIGALPVVAFKATSAFKALGDALKTSIGGLNDIFQAAFEGGGGVKGAIQSFGTDVVSNLTSLIPVVGGVISKFSGAIVAGFSKLFGHSQKVQVDALRESFVQLHGGLMPLAEEARKAGYNIENMLHASTIKGYNAELKKLNDLLKLQGDATDALTAAEDKYHFTSTATSADLLKNYKLLIAGNHSVSDTLGAMHEDFQTLVNDALKFGTTLPAELKDPLQQMADLGMLTDAAGNTLTDISGISFAAAGSSAETAFQKMTVGIDKLVAAIELSLGLALDDTEKKLLGIGQATESLFDRWLHGPNWVPAATPPDHSGPGFASGTYGRYLDFGAGTQVTLHGRERVMTEGEKEGWNGMDAVAALHREVVALPERLTRSFVVALAKTSPAR